MKQFKLINQQTKEESICEKVTVDGFDYYVNDDEIKSENWAWTNSNPHYNLILKVNKVGLNQIYTESGTAKLDTCKLVIATNNPNINIPKVVDEVEGAIKIIIGEEYYKAINKEGSQYQQADIESINNKIFQFKKENLPNAETPWHYEAEIWSGMQQFIKWAESSLPNKQDK